MYNTHDFSAALWFWNSAELGATEDIAEKEKQLCLFCLCLENRKKAAWHGLLRDGARGEGMLHLNCRSVAPKD